METVTLSPEQEQNLRSIGVISYLLHAIVAAGAVVPGFEPGVVLLLVAIVIDLVKRDDAAGSWQASHFNYRLRSVVYAGIAMLLTAPLFLLLYIPGKIAWFLIGLWLLYRIVKGWSALNNRRRHVVKLLRMLGLGLIVIDAANERGYVEVLLDPAEYRPRKSKSRQERLLGEFMKRVGDPNLGGSDRRTGIMTVYRQRAIAIARFLQQEPPAKASQIATTLRDPKARDILYRDVYGWFDRVSLGVYALSPRGQREILLWQPPEAAREITQPTRSISLRRSR